MIDVSKKYKISKFFYASSSSVYGDKNKFPVSENVKLYPKNIYGLSKSLMERLFCSSNPYGKTKFVCVRYGNVAWSTGSVLPIWKQMFNKNKMILTTGCNNFDLNNPFLINFSCVKSGSGQLFLNYRLKCVFS